MKLTAVDLQMIVVCLSIIKKSLPTSSGVTSYSQASSKLNLSGGASMTGGGILENNIPLLNNYYSTQQKLYTDSWNNYTSTLFTWFTKNFKKSSGVEGTQITDLNDMKKLLKDDYNKTKADPGSCNFCNP